MTLPNDGKPDYEAAFLELSRRGLIGDGIVLPGPAIAEALGLEYPRPDMLKRTTDKLELELLAHREGLFDFILEHEGLIFRSVRNGDYTVVERERQVEFAETHMKNRVQNAMKKANRRYRFMRDGGSMAEKTAAQERLQTWRHMMRKRNKV